MKVKHQAIKDQQPSMNVAGVDAWLGDTFVSSLASAANKEQPLCAGFFHLGAGQTLDYTYDYEEMKIVVDGEFHLTEVKTGQKAVAKMGDVIYFADGDHIIFEAPKGAIGFFCGQRKPL
jgi:ethanolamine utilization protein EutQ